MKYLCLAYHDGMGPDDLSAGAYAAFLAEVREHGEELRSSGHHVAASLLQPDEFAATIRVRNGRTTVSDGPAVAGRGQIGGFYLIDARDLNDAIRLAARMPPARYGSIEVRPLRELDRGDCRSSARPFDN